MTGKALFDFIQTLDKQEKANFTNMVNHWKAEKSSYYQLFKALESANEFEKEKVRSYQRFNTSQKYYNAKDKLISKLMESLVAHSQYNTHPQTYVTIALKKGAKNLASKKVIDEAQKATKEEDWNYLAYLYRFIAELKHACGFDIILPSSVPSKEWVFSSQKQEDRLRLILSQIKSTVLSGGSETRNLLEKIKSDLAEIVPFEGLCRYLHLKAGAVCILIEQGQKESIPAFRNVVEYLYHTNFPFCQAYLIKEFAHIAILECRLGSIDEARSYIFRLSKLVPQDLLLEQRKNKFLCKVHLSLSTARFFPDLPDQGYQFLLGNTSLFIPLELVSLMLSYAMVKLLQGQHKQCRTTLIELRSNFKSVWKGIEWTVETIDYLAMFATGSSQAMEIQLERMERVAKKGQRKLPKLYVSLFRHFGNSTTPEIARVWNSIASQLETIKEIPEERILFDQFNLFAWMDAFLNSKPLIDSYFSQETEFQRLHLHSG